MLLSHKNFPHSGENKHRKETAGHNNKITYECNWHEGEKRVKPNNVIQVKGKIT